MVMEQTEIKEGADFPATNAREQPINRLFGTQPAAWLYLLPSLILFAVFVFYPLFRTLQLSFFLSDSKGLPTVFVGFNNYARLLSSPEFLASAGSTLLFVLYTVPTTIILALILALLANEKLKGIGFFRTIFSSSMGISVAASSVVWLFIFNPSAGILNRLLSLLGVTGINWLADPNWALFSVSLTTIWLHLGFTFLILLGGLQNIDEHLYENAQIEGCGYWYRLRRITLPMLSPTLFFVITVSMIDAFQTFGQIDLLTKGGPGNATNLIVYSIYQKAFINFDFGMASAEVIVLFLCILLITALQFKFGERKVHYQ
ncbi:sugar ABC transporter permease [Sporolactobacillus shoreicorticis]|uniref:Carbohydrate ABC transporter permease n=1 Tax=Sporolactobacillus shoreicorticis TaxID=1923877 RepID=A0ABW5S5D5_9BACL|nr:sugar ABC transporter permease [Sporolactobacillus shoreicorticis]MCO7126193.1 sugar ABC transporter permease [Sporolactobacillus shoreicorticis]